MNMAFHQTQSTTMRQEQHLSPKMLQSLKYLQAPLPELHLMVQKEMLQNPALEEGISSEIPLSSLSENAFELGDPSDLFQAGADDGTPRNIQAETRREHFLDSLTASPTFAEYLRQQLVVEDWTAEQKRAITTLIGSMDADGNFSDDVTELAEEADVSPEIIEHILGILREYAPPVGQTVGDDPSVYIHPEIRIQPAEDGIGMEVEMLHENLPRLRLSNACLELLEDPETDPSAKTYLLEKIKNARFVIQAIQQRENTLYRIAKEIATIQANFFRHGITALHPLQQAEIAKTLSLHEATISRAVSGKYADTPQGIFELKFFFPHGLPHTKGNNAVSIEAAKAAIAKLIAKEDPRRPLSDQAIAQQLAAVDIPMARRTVAKYRDQLGFPPAHQR